MNVSVIIPTHNRVRTLRNTLAALADQTLSRTEFEVIVVDDGSHEDVRKQIREYRGPCEYTLIEQTQGGLASARNRGAARARGAILHFLDDDVLPHRACVKEHLAAHERFTEPVAVVGSLPYPPSVEMNAFLWYLDRSGHYDLYQNPRKYLEGRPPLPPMNGNSSIGRDLFFRIGMYDERFRRYGSEDLELGYRLQEAGIRFVYHPQAIGYHDHLKDFPQFCADMETAGESLIQVYRKHPEIRAAKNIDIIEDRLRDLPPRKRAIKLIMECTRRWPLGLEIARSILRRTDSFYSLRFLLFPLYRWIAYHHYALGMRRGLAGSER